MRNQLPTDNTLPVEEALRTFYHTPEPDPRFVETLAQQLFTASEMVEEEQTAVAPPFSSFWHNLWRNLITPFRQRRWATAVLLILTIFSLSLAAIGPQRAWAALQQWLSFVPGVGFADLQDTYLLPAPVSNTQQGVTLTVEQVLARPHQTTVVFHSTGLPAETLFPGGDDGEYRFRLHLPDGQILTSETWMLRVGGGSVTFPPLPHGVMAETDAITLTLEIGRLPLVPPGMAPESWRLPLVLEAATADRVAALYPVPYTPDNAVAEKDGVTVRVLEVAHTPQETAVRVQVQWADSVRQMRFLSGGPTLPYLRDELGQTYWYGVGSTSGAVAQRVVTPLAQTAPTPAPEQPTFSDTLFFQPLSLGTQQLTLVIEGLEFEVPAETAFTFDLGPQPQAGDKWPLDLRLDVAGFPLHITAARLISETLQTGPTTDDVQERIALQFDLEPSPNVAGLWLDASASGFSGGSSGQYDPQTGRRQIAVTVDVREPLPTGLITIKIPTATVVQTGPWELTWTVP